MNPVQFRFWYLAVPALFAVSHSVASPGHLFDENKRVVLSSVDATTILKSYVPDGNWFTEDWPVSSGELDNLERTLATALKRAKIYNRPSKLASVYRQYMTARWKGLRLIVVNGFDETMFDMERQLDKNADLTHWKRKLLVSFGGGCLQWRAVYIVEKNRWMVLNNLGHHATLLCNASK